MKKYYLEDNQRHIGPYSIEELRERNITRETPVWFEGLSNWTLAGYVPELEELFLGVPPPVVPVANIVASLEKTRQAKEVQEKRQTVADEEKGRFAMYKCGTAIAILVVIVLMLFIAAISPNFEDTTVFKMLTLINNAGERATPGDHIGIFILLLLVSYILKTIIFGIFLIRGYADSRIVGIDFAQVYFGLVIVEFVSFGYFFGFTPVMGYVESSFLLCIPNMITGSLVGTQ